MSKLPNCEKDSLKPFINILRAYELDQQRENKVGVVKSFKSKIEILTYQPQQGGHLRITKEELQKLEVDQHNLNNIVAIEKLQQFEHQGLDPNAIKKQIRTQDSNMDVEG